MRISDWSSDVCSSDLNNRPATVGARPPRSTPASPVITATACCDTPSTKHSRHRPVRQIKEVPRDDETDDENRGLPLAPAQGDEDRKRVVMGKSVSVRVDLGGRRSSKKNKKNKK